MKSEKNKDLWVEKVIYNQIVKWWIKNKMCKNKKANNTKPNKQKLAQQKAVVVDNVDDRQTARQA